MPRHIVKLVDKQANKDYYLEWSTIVDAPVSYGMGLTEFREYYKQKYGTEGLAALPDRLKRVEEKGTSATYDKSVEDTIDGNRAGPDETELTYDELVRYICLQEEMPTKMAPPV